MYRCKQLSVRWVISLAANRKGICSVSCPVFRHLSFLITSTFTTFEVLH